MVIFFYTKQMLRFIILSVLILLSTDAYGVCGQILKNVQAPVVGGVGRYFLAAGEIYPAKGRNKEGTKFTFMVGAEVVVVNRNQVRLLKGEICNQKKAPLPEVGGPPAATTEQPQQEGKEFVPLDEATLPPPVAEKSVEKPSKKPVERREEVKSTKIEEPPSKPKEPWRYGVEIGYTANISSDSYSDLITAVPDPTNVGGLQDPIITDVESGTDYHLRGFMEKRINPKFISQLGLGYRQQTFTYKAKSNPSTGAVRLDQLTGFEKQFQVSIIELGAGVAYIQKGRRWSFGYGVHADLLYSLSGKTKIDVLTPSGPFFKNTPATVEDGPETLGYKLSAKVDARRSNYRIILDVATDTSISLSFGYLFD